QVYRDVIRRHARQLTGYHHAVVAEPNVDRREIARRRGIPGEQAVHFALHSAEFDERVETQPGKFGKRHGFTLLGCWHWCCGGYPLARNARKARGRNGCTDPTTAEIRP